jgi:Pentapeptide repeats (8 copies)
MINNTSITQSDLDDLITLHAKWWDTRGESGDNLTLYQYSLSNLRFKGQNLRGGNLSRCDCQGCNFQSADLTSINVTNTDFRGADFSNAILKKTDFRNVKIDGSTSFTNAEATGMIVDWNNYQNLPPFIQSQNLTITNRNVIEIIFEVETELNRDLLVQIVNDMTDYVEQHNEGIQVSSSREGSQYRLTIETPSVENVEKVRHDIHFFGEVLMGKARLPNERDHVLLESKFDNLKRNYDEQVDRRRELQLLYADSREEILKLKEEIKAERESGRSERQSFLRMLENTGTQMQLQSRPEPKTLVAPETSHTFSTTDRKNLKVETNKIVCILTEGKGERIAQVYVQNEAKPISVLFSKFEALAMELNEKNSRLFKCNKGQIIHLDTIEETILHTGNRTQIKLKGLDLTDIFVARDYKPKFDLLKGNC